MTPIIVIKAERSAYEPAIGAYPEFLVKARPPGEFSSQQYPKLWSVHCSPCPADKPTSLEARMSPVHLVFFCANATRLFSGKLRIMVEKTNMSEQRSLAEIVKSLRFASLCEVMNLDIQKSAPWLKGLKGTAQLIASLGLMILLGLPALFWGQGREIWKESVHQFLHGAVHVRNAIAGPMGFSLRLPPQRPFVIKI